MSEQSIALIGPAILCCLGIVAAIFYEGPSRDQRIGFGIATGVGFVVLSICIWLLR